MEQEEQGLRHSSDLTVVQGDFVSKNRGLRSPRNYYFRYFPQNSSHLLDSLKPDEFVAVVRLHRERALRDGPLSADDKLLATITKMTDKAWASLRDKLLMLGLARVENGMWIDDDQERSLEIQRNSRLRGPRGAEARWREVREVREVREA